MFVILACIIINNIVILGKKRIKCNREIFIKYITNNIFKIDPYIFIIICFNREIKDIFKNWLYFKLLYAHFLKMYITCLIKKRKKKLHPFFDIISITIVLRSWEILSSYHLNNYLSTINWHKSVYCFYSKTNMWTCLNCNHKEKKKYNHVNNIYK